VRTKLSLFAACALVLAGLIGVPAARADTPNPLDAWTSKRVDIPATAAVYVPLLGKFLVTVSPEHKSLGNELVEVDPASGELRRHVFVGDHPTNLAVSDDGLVAYVGFHGTNRIARVDLVTFALVTYFPLVPPGTGRRQVEDLAVVPGHDDLVVASLGDPFTTPRDAGVWAYKDGHVLPLHTDALNSPTLIEMADASTIYGFTETYSAPDFWTLSLTDDGVTLVRKTEAPFAGNTIKMAGDNIVTEAGALIDPKTATVTRRFGDFAPYDAGGVEPQPGRDLITFYAAGTISQFVLSTGQLLWSRDIHDFHIYPTHDLVASDTGFAVVTGDALFLLGPSLRDGTIHYPPVAPSTLDAMHERLVPVQAYDLVYDALRQSVYASVPAAANDPRANKIVAIDLLTGTVSREVYVGGDPGALALTDDHTTLYVSLRATREIVRINLLTFSEVERFNVGTVADTAFGQVDVLANDIEVEPLVDNAVVATLTLLCCSPSFKAVAVFRDGDRLPDMVTGFQGPTLLGRDALGRLYGGRGENGTEVTELRPTLSGVEADAVHAYSAWPMYSFDLNGGLGWSGGGVVFDPDSDTVVATPGYAGAFEATPLLGRAYEISGNFVREYELPQFRQIATRLLSAPIPGYTIARTMVGTGLGLASATDAGVVLLDYSLCGGLRVTMKAAGGVTTGTPGDDVIAGSDGPDTIDGGGGNDVICGGDGDDVILGGDGNDRLLGGAGRDRLTGGAGDDDIDGGAGTDSVVLGDDAVAHVVDLDNIADDGITGLEHDNVRATNEVILGSPGPDTLIGNEAAQLLRGGDGNDVLFGVAGDDRLDDLGFV